MSNTRTFSVAVEEVIASRYHVTAESEEGAEQERLDVFANGVLANVDLIEVE